MPDRTGAEAKRIIGGRGCPGSVYQTIADSQRDPHGAMRGSAVEIEDHY